MRILFLGTGQRERVPLPYHKDRICTEARKPGTKENRTQSSIIISENNTFLLFDVTEHFLEQIKRESIDLNSLTAIFATDSHEESIGGLHFLDKQLNKVVKFYSSVKVAERVKQRFGDLKNIEIKGLEDEKTIKIGKISVTPFEVSSSIQKRHPAFAYEIRCKKVKVVYSKNSADVPEDKRHYYGQNDCLILGGAIQDAIWFANLGNKLEIFTWIGHGDFLHKEMEKEVKKKYKKLQAKSEVKMAHDGLEVTLGSKQRPSTRGKLMKAGKALDEDSGRALIPEKIARKKIKWAMYEVPPFGKLIWEGKKTLIVRDVKLAKHIKEPLLLCSGEYAYGVVVLEQGIEIDLKKFEELRGKHFVSDGLRKNLWPNSKNLYIYDFLFEKIDNIIKFKKVKGFTDFIEISKIEFVQKELDLKDWVANFTLLPDEFLKIYIEKLTSEALSKISREELICFHIRQHYLWGRKFEGIFWNESLAKAHCLTIQEFEKRKPSLKHEAQDSLDKISKTLEKEIADKNTNANSVISDITDERKNVAKIGIYGRIFFKVFDEEGNWKLVSEDGKDF